ncbi:MAG: hypothetical protein ACT4OP_04780 [Actinomycetota bacterium]
MTIRPVLGIVALALAGLGGWLWIEDDQATGGIFLRVGLVLGALWLAAPSLRRLDGRRLLPIAIAVALAAARPALLIWLGPALLAWVLVRRRRM